MIPNDEPFGWIVPEGCRALRLLTLPSSPEMNLLTLLDDYFGRNTYLYRMSHLID